MTILYADPYGAYERVSRAAEVTHLYCEHCQRALPKTESHSHRTYPVKETTK